MGTRVGYPAEIKQKAVNMLQKQQLGTFLTVVSMQRIIKRLA
ncbi:hypothetical protein AB1K91_12215 [Terribacillus sp. 179-K 1B1 HS]